MASRLRQSNAHSTPRQSRGGTVQPTPSGSAPSAVAPPPYQSPSFTLNPNAQRALAQLTRSNNLRKLDESIAEAQSILTNAATDINEKQMTHNESLEKVRKTVQAKRDANEDVDDYLRNHKGTEEKYANFQQQVNNYTERLEESMRKLVDSQHSIALMKSALEESAEEARNNASTQASTQNLRSQRARRSTRNDDDDREMEDDDEIEEFEPTDPAAGTQPVKAPLDIFRQILDDTKTQYQAYSAYDRYGENNKYIDFKRSLHDALHPNDDIELAPAMEWFTEDGTVAQPGVTRRDGDDSDNDSDIAMTRAKMSTKCPLTLREFEDPLTSKKCQHSFEATAIMDLMKQGGARNTTVQCPVGGCKERLSKSDLERNDYVRRKVKKLQRIQQRADEDDDEDEEGGTQRSGHVNIDDIDDDLTELTTQQLKAAPMKKEPRASGASAGPSGSRPPGGTQVIDLGDDDDEDEE